MAGGAYYNEHDPFAAAWLRELIADGLIAPGEVDERSIEDVRPSDLAGFVQCHFFAGIGIWSLALRQAGWPDDEPIWTGSCPCPPFSSAGKEFRCPLCNTRSPVPNAVRTGAFDCIRCGHEWQADARHLFPEFFRLIRDAQPELVLGEQVASKDGRTWIDVVRASLEMLGYAVGHPDVPACGFGAPHIRQRLYWMADALPAGRAEGWAGAGGRPLAGCDEPFSLADANDARLEGRLAERERAGERAARSGGVGGGLADSDGGNACTEGLQRGGEQRQQPQDGGALRGEDSGAWARRIERLDDAASARHERSLGNAEGNSRDEARLRLPDAGRGESYRPGPLNGLWRDADWLCCTDGKWRPAAPGTFPLAPAGTVRNRVGLLRGAGNAINLAQAQGFVEAVIEVRGQAQRLAA